jgi:hypothetical protein
MVVPGSNGLINLSIPISGGRNCKLRMDEVTIDNQYHWQRDHLRTLSSVYGRSPFFNFYADDLKALMDQPNSNLLDWNLSCLQWIIQRLKCVDELPIMYKSNESEIRDDVEMDDGVYDVPAIKYSQVFEQNIGFQADLSILDLLFNQGPKICTSFMGFST